MDVPGPAESKALETTPTRPDDAPDGGDLLATMTRMEDVAREIRAHVEQLAREKQHYEYSAFHIAAGVVQAVALVLLVWAGIEYMFVVAERYSTVLMKLAFAVVLQLMAITALLADPTSRQ